MTSKRSPMWKRNATGITKKWAIKYGWTENDRRRMLYMLGRRKDAEVANQFEGPSAQSITRLRKQLGIKRHRKRDDLSLYVNRYKSFRNKHPDAWDLLGKIPDTVIAEKFGIDSQTVCGTRIKYNIPKCDIKDYNRTLKSSQSIESKPNWLQEFLKQEAEWVASNGSSLGIELSAMVAGFQEISNAPAPWRNGGTRTLSKGTSDEQFAVSASKWLKNRGGF